MPRPTRAESHESQGRRFTLPWLKRPARPTAQPNPVIDLRLTFVADETSDAYELVFQYDWDQESRKVSGELKIAAGYHPLDTFCAWHIQYGEGITSSSTMDTVKTLDLVDVPTYPWPWRYGCTNAFNTFNYVTEVYLDNSSAWEVVRMLRVIESMPAFMPVLEDLFLRGIDFKIAEYPKYGTMEAMLLGLKGRPLRSINLTDCYSVHEELREELQSAIKDVEVRVDSFHRERDERYREPSAYQHPRIRYLDLSEPLGGIDGGFIYRATPSAMESSDTQHYCRQEIARFGEFPVF